VKPAVLFAIVAVCAIAGGCGDDQALHLPDPGLERMVGQPRVDPYGGSSFFADGRGMRPTPAGTVGRDDPPRFGTIATGRDGDHWSDRAPLPIDRPLLERGHDRFEAFCAACHGALGDGDSVVARRMELVRPRDLQSAEALAYPIGRIYGAATTGFGLMPSYAAQLSQRERWAVAAYVKSLQLSRHARLDDLPEPMRERARQELP
jgi:mono/diheme cytochrome c family protein